MLGFISLIAAGGSYWAASREPLALLAVVVFLALNWFGDSLDGTVARVRNRQRPRYGFYVDHILDAIGAAFLSACLLLSIEIYLATHTLGRFHFRIGALVPLNYACCWPRATWRHCTTRW